MLYLKKINFEDVEEEYKAIKSMPAQENGFENKYHDVTKEEFINEVIPKLLKNSEGLDLPDGYVPDTYFFLWDDDKIVGLFKIRHYLNDFLRKGAGHIGYGILPEYRGKGYAKKGLVLAIEKCKEIIKENEIYLSVHKDNPASLRVQLGCGAFIVGETEEEYLTRIKLKYNNITFGFRDLRRDDWKRITEKEVIVEDEKNDFFEGNYTLNSYEIRDYKSIDGIIGKELYINLDLDVYAPFTVTKKTDYIYFRLNGNNAQITIISPHLLLKYFFKNYKDYYYLPEEDITIHKDVATYVDKNHRIQATASNCFTKVTDNFLPIFSVKSPDFNQIFIENYGEKNGFIQLESIKDEDCVLKYVNCILDYLY